MNDGRYTSVDDLQAQISLSDAAAKCGVPLDVHGTGKQIRLDCPFGCPGDHAGKREISVDAGNPQKVFCCHAYGCQVRGNLLTLMHGWSTGALPAGGRLKGAEFKHVRDILTGSGTISDNHSSASVPAESPSSPGDALCNNPLVTSANEKARELSTLDEKFERDVACMPPAAASYVRRHPSLSLASIEKWRAGVLPADGGGDKRAWSLRGQMLYPVLSEDGFLLAWVARDPQFEQKDQAFNQLAADERARQKKPAKHRFPVDFHRGLELFGQRLCCIQRAECVFHQGLLGQPAPLSRWMTLLVRSNGNSLNHNHLFRMTEKAAEKPGTLWDGLRHWFWNGLGCGLFRGSRGPRCLWGNGPRCYRFH